MKTSNGIILSLAIGLLFLSEAASADTQPTAAAPAAPPAPPAKPVIQPSLHAALKMDHERPRRKKTAEAPLFGVESAAQLAARRAETQAGQEERIMNDGNRVTKVTGVFGTYCGRTVSPDELDGIDQMQHGARTVVTYGCK